MRTFPYISTVYKFYILEYKRGTHLPILLLFFLTVQGQNSWNFSLYIIYLIGLNWAVGEASVPHPNLSSKCTLSWHPLCLISITHFLSGKALNEIWYFSALLSSWGGWYYTVSLTTAIIGRNLVVSLVFRSLCRHPTSWMYIAGEPVSIYSWPISMKMFSRVMHFEECIGYLVF